MQRIKWKDQTEYEENFQGLGAKTLDMVGKNLGTGQLVQNFKDNSRMLMDQATLMQQETTKQLMERMKDVNTRKSMLEKEIQDLIAISDTLTKQGKRMQKADGCVNLANKVNDESILTRKKRQKIPGENWRLDKVDTELEAETYLVKEVAGKLQEAIREFENQIISNTEAKNRLEHDWSRKKEAYEYDYRSAALTNESADASMFKQSSANFAASMSYPDEWHRYSNNVVTVSNDQRLKSEQLLQKINGLMKDTSRDLKIQADRIDATLTDSIRSLVEHIQNVGSLIKIKDGELKQVDKTSADMKNLKESKEIPLKVALARLDQRNKRAGVELCNDNAHQALLREVAALENMLGQLSDRLDEAGRVGKMLNDEIQGLRAKENALRFNFNLDSDILRNVRAICPPQIQLTGYVV